MDIFILILTCIVNFILGLIVLMRDIRKAYALLFASICILLSVWIVSNFVTNHYLDDLAITNLANNVTFMSGYGILLSALFFTYVFPVKRHISFYEIGSICLMAVVILSLSATESVAGIVTLGEDGKLAFSIGPLLWLYAVGFISTLALIVRNLLVTLKKETGPKRQQARLVLFAFGATAFVGLLLNVLIPLALGDWSSTRFGPLAAVILVATIAYTIVKHGLFDIRLAVVRGATYVLSLMTLAATYYLVAYGISQTVFFGQQTYVDQSPLNILLALLLAFIFQPVKHFFDRLTNRIFYRDNYDIGDFFAKLSRELSMSTDLRALLQRAANEINNTIKAEHSFFFVRYGERRHMNVDSGHQTHLSLAEIRLLDEYIVTQDQAVILTDILAEKHPLRHSLEKHKIALTLPLRKNGQALGYLFLGYQRSRDYTQRDIRALETISDELIIAIQNALSIQEVKDINATLQQRINEATKELRASNTQLQKLDEAKDEFVSMASHQLRTPLTSVKGYISMVLEGDAGKITSTQKRLLEEAFTSSERMVHLIGDFLNVSRLQTGKFLLEQKPVDLAKVVGQEVDSLKTTAQAHNLKLEYRAPAYFPILYVDEGKLRQVLMNFMDNAIYYSQEETTIVIKLTVEDGNVVLRVKDTGIGVPKAEQAHLFTKFFRATNARKQRPDGTGVGLFLAKKVIVAHGGSMVFESTEGEGSTFGFRLPVKKLSSAPADDADKLDK